MSDEKQQQPPAGDPDEVWDSAEQTDEADRAEREAQAGLVRETVSALRAEDSEKVNDLVSDLHAADLADLIEQMDGPDRKAFGEAYREGLDPEVLSELEGQALEDLMSALNPGEIAAAVSQLETDDAVWVLEELDESDQKEILKKIRRTDRIPIEEGLGYPEESAGRLMQRDLVAVPNYWSVGQVIDYLREDDKLPDDFYEIFVVDPAHAPIGTMPLSHVMRAKRDQKVVDIMTTEQTLIPVDMDQEDVAYRFRQYNLVSAAVVDNAGRLVGVITVDDIVDVIEEEAEEDILALGGVRESDLAGTVSKISRARLGWLVVNLGTAILASLVIGLFDASIEKLVALAILMPIVASMGGNAGTQTMTVAVRALAVRELTSANAFKMVSKELTVSFLNGIMLAVLTGVVTLLWFQDVVLGVVIAAAMIINLVMAGLSGILVPMVLDRLGVDPAVASTVFVTTITDIVGFFSFLGLAALVLL